MKAEPKVVEVFLKAYVAGIQLIKKDRGFTERVFAKWLREKDAAVVKRSVEAYARIFKPKPFVPDKGIENVIHDLAGRRPVSKEFFGRPELFRDHAPLEKVLARK